LVRACVVFSALRGPLNIARGFNGR
jgi:hypothetical protein